MVAIGVHGVVRRTACRVYAHLRRCYISHLNLQKIMAAHEEDPIAYVLTTAITHIKRLLPDWTPPNLKHPLATPTPYKSGYAMLGKLKPGAQIMVRDASGYRHHGIFVGQQVVSPGDLDVPAVVDVWGPTKEEANVSLRSYEDFVGNGKSFAEALYPEGAALDQSLSASLALALVLDAKEKENTFVYNAAFNNCEHFATMCRCLRCACDAIDARFEQLHAANVNLAPPPRPRGFAGI
jgi:hypothetical protein